DAAVADVREDQSVADAHDGVEGRSHARLRGARAAELVDMRAGLLDRLRHGAYRRGPVRVGRIVAEAIEDAPRRSQLLVHRGYRGARRDLPVVVPAHSVGHEEDPSGLIDDDGVLVVLALLAYIAGATRGDRNHG